MYIAQRKRLFWMKQLTKRITFWPVDYIFLKHFATQKSLFAISISTMNVYYSCMLDAHLINNRNPNIWINQCDVSLFRASLHFKLKNICWLSMCSERIIGWANYRFVVFVFKQLNPERKLEQIHSNITECISLKIKRKMFTVRFFSVSFQVRIGSFHRRKSERRINTNGW